MIFRRKAVDDYREYILYFGETYVGDYVCDGEERDYNFWLRPDDEFPEELKALLKELKLHKDISKKRPIEPVEKLLTDENRASDTKKIVYRINGLEIRYVPQREDRFVVYYHRANEGEPGYSEKRYSAPHSEANGEIEGMSEWCQWYYFNKMDDGSFEAELDEAWCWGGGHNDGGTMNEEIPAEWFELPYLEFLENVLTVARAGHYGFTVEELAVKKGLKEFFGFAD